jgi:hypothetical protein
MENDKTLLIWSYIGIKCNGNRYKLWNAICKVSHTVNYQLQGKWCVNILNKTFSNFDLNIHVVNFHCVIFKAIFSSFYEVAFYSHGCHFKHACTRKPLNSCRKFKWESVQESLKMNVTEQSRCLLPDDLNRMWWDDSMSMWGTDCYGMSILRARSPLIAVHLTQRHCKTHVAWATTRLHWTQRQLCLHSCGFSKWMPSCLEWTSWAVLSRIRHSTWPRLWR